jgi:hypothetical protein
MNDRHSLRGIYAYPWDFIDEGTDVVLDRVAGRAGADSVFVTSWYHSGMFFLPHNPKRKVIFPEPGALYFRPGKWYDSSALRPPVSTLSDDWPAFWSELRSACDRRSVGLTSWMPILHNSGTASRYPQHAVRNAWGDAITHSLCPSDEPVRQLVVDVVGGVADSGLFDRILLESIEYLPLQHGYHHEVIGVPISPVLGFLTSLCCCQACLARARSNGVDGARLTAWIRDTVGSALAGDAGDLPTNWLEIEACVDGDLGRYLRLRAEGLTETVRRVRERVDGSASRPRIAILDFGPLYPLGPNGRSWQSGVDLSQQLPLIDEVHPTFYFTDAEVLEQKVAEYVQVLAGERPMFPAIRAILPQTTGKESLRDQVRATAANAEGFTFYNYSFMSLATLDWISAALTGAQS